jgi:hypothetical protein
MKSTTNPKTKPMKTTKTSTEGLTAAKTLSYNPDTDELFADGKLVGGASDLTRDIMLARLADPAEHADDSDETLFDLVVEQA